MNDRVPEKWRPFFTNEEWVQHDFIVKASWLQAVLAFVVHGAIWLVKPWFTNGA